MNLTTEQNELEIEGRAWRDSELSATDYIVPLFDHPEHHNTLAYRWALRNWPSTDSFPNTRPELQTWL